MGNQESSSTDLNSTTFTSQRMANRAAASSGPESTDWQDSKEFRYIVERFHAIYAMPPEKLTTCQAFHERVLHDFFENLGFCTDIKRIGGSYEGVKVVKSDKDDFEFDVMFVLKIPEECQLEIVEISERPGYAILKVANGCGATQNNYRLTNQKFFAGCLTLENGAWIVDAGNTTAAFFGALQRWINTNPVKGFKLVPKQHGTAIQMDVIYGENSVVQGEFYYSVDIAPTIEIVQEGEVQRYVAKPEKKRNPDSVTWRRLFDPKQVHSNQGDGAIRILRSSVDDLQKQLSDYCASCNGVCRGSCILPEAIAFMPLPVEYMLKLQAALTSRDSDYRLTFVNLQELSNSKNKRLVAIQYFFPNELEVLPVPEKPGYVWLKFEAEDSACSRFNSALKLCFLPGGKYLDTKAASDLLVKELRNIVNGLFDDQDVIVRRDGPIVRIEVYPENRNPTAPYSLDIILAAYVDGDFYTGLPDDYDDIPDKVAWRRSYSYEESMKIQQSPEGLKKVFRVLKALRNGEPGLASLTSYHFKTLLLNMRKLKTMNWDDNIAKIFVCVLKYLKICLDVNRLQTYFIPEINLLERMTNDCRVHMQNRIEELLRSRRKMFKALRIPSHETPYDLLEEHYSESTEVCSGSRFMPGPSSRSLESVLLPEIEEQLLGYNYGEMTFRPLYEDITVYRLFSEEDELLHSPTEFYAIMLINNNKNSLGPRRYNPSVIRLERCNSTVSSSLLHTVTHSSGLADTRKTAEYIKRQMEKLIRKSSLLHDFVDIYLNGSDIVLQSDNDLCINVLPGYEVGEEVFIAMPGAANTCAWMPVPFTPVRNRYWKAFKINDCGREVLNQLRRLRQSVYVLGQLRDRHLRMALFWEMEIQRDWSDDKVAERVNDVLDRLLDSVRQKKLPSYFDPTSNTL